jgi:hypothetical protein
MPVKKAWAFIEQGLYTDKGDAVVMTVAMEQLRARLEQGASKDIVRGVPDAEGATTLSVVEYVKLRDRMLLDKKEEKRNVGTFVVVCHNASTALVQRLFAEFRDNACSVGVADVMRAAQGDTPLTALQLATTLSNALFPIPIDAPTNICVLVQDETDLVWFDSDWFLSKEHARCRCALLGHATTRASPLGDMMCVSALPDLWFISNANLRDERKEGEEVAAAVPSFVRRWGELLDRGDDAAPTTHEWFMETAKSAEFIMSLGASAMVGTRLEELANAASWAQWLALSRLDVESHAPHAMGTACVTNANAHCMEPLNDRHVQLGKDMCANDNLYELPLHVHFCFNNAPIHTLHTRRATGVALVFDEDAFVHVPPAAAAAAKAPKEEEEVLASNVIADLD